TSKTLPPDAAEPEEPAYDPQELYGVVSADVRKPYDVREVIARVVDGSRFDEFKERYAPTIVTGFARVHGLLIGIIANHGVLFSESALKAAAFMELGKLRGISWSCAACAAFPSCFCRTSPDSWSASSTSAEVSPRTARRWCTQWRT